MDREGPSQCRRVDFGQTEVVDQSLMHQLGHSAHRLFNRSRRIRAMEVVKVHVVGSQAIQALMKIRGDEFGPRQTVIFAVRSRAPAEFRRKYEGITLAA